MNTTKIKLLLLCVGIMLSCNAVAASKSNKPATVKQLKAETAARLAADQALQAAIKGLVLTPGPAGAPGAQGAPGAPGAQGAPIIANIASTTSFAGQMDVIPANGTDLSFYGPTAVVTITATQTITATATAVLATTTGTALFKYNLCYQNVSTPGPITEFTPGNYFSVTATVNSTSFNASQSEVFGVAGDYKIGMCIQNLSDNTAIDNNGWMEGWVLVSN